MKILIDMNLSPNWVEALARFGHEAVHWSQIGAFNASDLELFSWAKANGFIVFTHDLDFGSILASTQADAPSVIQVRTQNVTPAYLQDRLNEILVQYESALHVGVLIILDESKSRIRILPIS